MKRIISVSRRTDIPAFYGDWLMNRLKAGFVGVVSPFGGKKYVVSLKPEDVLCFVFWSKNFTPFLEHLKTVDDLDFRFYFNYTVTALPVAFEGNVDKQAGIKTLKTLSRIYSPAHINWRFDPIIISSGCDSDYYIKEFEHLACEFEGLVERCYFSFVTLYDKVKRNLQEIEKATSIKVNNCNEDLKIDLANRLAEIAQGHGMTLYSCCGDYLVNNQIKKGHCIDGNVIEHLFFPEGLKYEIKPTRPECGCTESTDIGAYDTCPHGCVYCYANANKRTAQRTYARHEPESVFLGFGKADSDRWLDEIQHNQGGNEQKQFELF